MVKISRLRYSLLLCLLFRLLCPVALASQTDTLRLEAPPVVVNGQPTIHYAYVYIPEAAAKQALPVVYLMHGFMGNQFSWEDRAGVTELLDSLIDSGTVKPLIAVMPYCIPHDTTQAVSRRSFVYNASHYSRLKKGEFERTFSGLDSLLRECYNILPDSCCAVAGLSYGGRVAANLALGHDYLAIGLFSPVISREQFPDCEGGSHRSCSSLYWVRIGKHDFFEPRSRRFRRYMQDNGLRMDYRRTPGGHNWRNWRQYLIDFLKDNYAVETIF